MKITNPPCPPSVSSRTDFSKGGLGGFDSYFRFSYKKGDISS